VDDNVLVAVLFVLLGDSKLVAALEQTPEAEDGEEVHHEDDVDEVEFVLKE
jgi:hypothetical protein